MYFLLRYIKRPLLRDLLVSGAALTVSVYVRPIAYLLPVMVALGLSGWAFLNGQETRRLIIHTAVFLIVSMGITVPWQVRNRAETGYSGFSGISAINMYFCLSVAVLASQRHVSHSEMQDRLGYRDERIYFERHPEQKTWQPGQRLDYINRQAENILLSSPLTYARIHLEGMVRTLFGPGATLPLKFFKLYPEQDVLVYSSVLETMGALMVKRQLVFWSNALLLLLELPYLFCTCVVLFSSRRGEAAVVAAMLTVIYFVTISGGPRLQPVPPSRNAYHLRSGRVWPVSGMEPPADPRVSVHSMRLRYVRAATQGKGLKGARIPKRTTFVLYWTQHLGPLRRRPPYHP
jgi:hypothetical protein